MGVARSVASRAVRGRHALPMGVARTSRLVRRGCVVGGRQPRCARGAASAGRRPRPHPVHDAPHPTRPPPRSAPHLTRPRTSLGHHLRLQLLPPLGPADRLSLARCPCTSRARHDLCAGDERCAASSRATRNGLSARRRPQPHPVHDAARFTRPPLHSAPTSISSSSCRSVPPPASPSRAARAPRAHVTTCAQGTSGARQAAELRATGSPRAHRRPQPHPVHDAAHFTPPHFTRPPLHPAPTSPGPPLTRPPPPAPAPPLGPAHCLSLARCPWASRARPDWCAGDAWWAGGSRGAREALRLRAGGRGRTPSTTPHTPLGPHLARPPTSLRPPPRSAPHLTRPPPATPAPPRRSAPPAASPSRAARAPRAHVTTCAQGTSGARGVSGVCASSWAYSGIEVGGLALLPIRAPGPGARSRALLVRRALPVHLARMS